MNQFKKLRNKLGLSQEGLARKLGISTSSVVNYEREPTDEIMQKMQKLIKKEAV